MLFQDDGGSCGAFATTNALLSFGQEVDVQEVKRIAKTTYRYGTSKRGIVRAVKHYGRHPTIYYTRSENNAWKWLRKWAALHPIIVLLDDREHWATIIGKRGHRVILCDPAWPDSELENNTHSMLKREFVDRWNGRGFYAIKVT